MAQAALFLSCLYGSERITQVDVRAVKFLSCLYGSELSYQVVVMTRLFSELPIRQ